MNRNRRRLLSTALHGAPALAWAVAAGSSAQDKGSTPASDPNSGAAAPAPPAASPATPLPYPARSDVRQFIDAIVAAHGLERSWLEAVLGAGRYAEIAERLTTPSASPTAPRNWLDYRARNVDERRIREGLSFWRSNVAALTRASLQFGVPPEIIVSIVGIESHFGRLMGNVRVLDALLTLSFDYTRRAPLYRDELTHYLLLCREQGIDPLALRGSFAGAIGMPQFMPGSIRRYAVDFDGDKRVDLISSRTDVVGSVANFLYQHGWERELPIGFVAQADEGIVEILGKGIRAIYRWQDVAALGVTLQGKLPDDTRVLLMNLPTIATSGEPGMEYRIGTVNMAALLHYNRSYFYATAVFELAQALRSAFERNDLARAEYRRPGKSPY